MSHIVAKIIALSIALTTPAEPSHLVERIAQGDARLSDYNIAEIWFSENAREPFFSELEAASYALIPREVLSAGRFTPTAVNCAWIEIQSELAFLRSVDSLEEYEQLKSRALSLYAPHTEAVQRLRHATNRQDSHETLRFYALADGETTKAWYTEGGQTRERNLHLAIESVAHRDRCEFRQRGAQALNELMAAQELRIEFVEENADTLISLVIHASHEPTLQESFLNYLDEQAVAQEIPHEQRARLIDRIMYRAGGVQLYGTQGQCIEGVWRPVSISSPEAIHSRRATLRMAPLEEYEAVMSQRCP
jgi:hypothetical protein